jgi:toxin YoeB
MFTLVYTKQANKDAKKVRSAGFKDRVLDLLHIIRNDPYHNPPPYEKLVGDLSGAISRRINIQHRLVYQVDEKRNLVKILRMWTHYE